MSVLVQVLLHLGAALVAGGMVGMDRTFHGRAAGFRTHALVCLASSALMLLPVYWATEALRIDPTRMAQGIMTGIGFLGAGAIFREGLSVRGLTTAASIWVTAAIGILVGVGLWIPAALVSLATLVVLSVFRWIEMAVPVHHYAEFRVRFARATTPLENEVMVLLSADGLEASDVSYRLVEGGSLFEYAGTVSGKSAGHFSRLAKRLRDSPNVREFAIEPY